MSDVLTAFDLHKFKQKVSLCTDLCLNYARKRIVNENEIVFTVKIPYEHLISLYDLKQNGELAGFSYVEILNAFISQHSIKVKVDCERINGILRRCCGEIHNKYRKLKGRRKAEYEKTCKNISIYCNEIVQLSQLEEELKVARENVDTLAKENVYLKDQRTVISEELATIQQSKRNTEQDLDNIKNEHERVLKENEELRDYIDKIGSPNDCRNTGKVMPDVGKRQQDRKLKELKTDVERTLWFAETYGLKLESANFSDNSGASYGLTFNDCAQKKKYKDLPEAEKQKIKQILLIQDKFCIGEAAYHELTMIPAGESLPRSYLIKQCKDSLNELCHIERTPGKAEGAQFNLYNSLQSAIQKHVSC